ncbi:protein SCAI-like [Ctenocephalides felis]|uniref:protein SCAI-like n=1 Tax=Ctenocephalides felis TaxID=7515 RepID=UPI000E6E5940|nr:protein SCAI-like [Ctenocephalides felis]
MVTMSGPEDPDRKVVLEFCHLLEKSKQLFNGLRDLPQYGHRQWQAYFGRTFDVYTRLWKFQQQHRPILDRKYGLKRWQIGEIASKIGQLYYHYYLRTSETSYLNEAYSFYAAIRGRAYYSRALKEDRSDLMVKKLRYYARFIMVCLLLKKMKLARELVQELDRHIGDYSAAYAAEDRHEWMLVLDEAKCFLKAEGLLQVVHPDTGPVILSHRLGPLTAPPPLPHTERPLMNLTLQEALLVGNRCDQVKFSEITADMYRMLQTLEREPGGYAENGHHYSSRSRRHHHSGGPPSYRSTSLIGENPHKYLLYAPTLAQLLLFLAAGSRELPQGGALLLYLSADACFGASIGYESGGVVTSTKRDTPPPSHHHRAPPHCHTDDVMGHGKDPHCLYPGDLYPFTRRPMFLVVDSDNSFAFQNIPRYFGQPLVALLSPQDIPPAFQDLQRDGSLFTLFLHSPLLALCRCCHIVDLSAHTWDRCRSQYDRFASEVTRLMLSHTASSSGAGVAADMQQDGTGAGIGEAEKEGYLHFFGDEYLRTLILRFVFCDNVLRLHRGFRSRRFRPKCSPPLPIPDLLEHPALGQIVLQLAQQLDARSHFSEDDSGAATGASLSTPPTGVQSGATGGVSSWERDTGRRQHVARSEMMQQE